MITKIRQLAAVAALLGLVASPLALAQNAPAPTGDKQPKKEAPAGEEAKKEESKDGKKKETDKKEEQKPGGERK